MKLHEFSMKIHEIAIYSALSFVRGRATDADDGRTTNVDGGTEDDDGRTAGQTLRTARYIFLHTKGQHSHSICYEITRFRKHHFSTFSIFSPFR